MGDLSGAFACHVALEAAFEAPAFLHKFLSFVVHEFLECGLSSNGGGVNIHQDDTVVILSGRRGHGACLEQTGLKSHGFPLLRKSSPALVSFHIFWVSFLAASIHSCIIIGSFSRFKMHWWTLSQRLSANLSIVP